MTRSNFRTSLEDSSGLRRAYLLTWNPREWHWDELERLVQANAEGNPILDTWSTGNTKSIKPDDRVFLMHLGEEPKGIVGSGTVISDVEEGPHYNEQRAMQGETRLFVHVEFDHLLNPVKDEPLPLDALRRGELASVNWTPQASGTQIKVGVEELERLWREHLRIVRPVSESPEVSALEGEPRLRMMRHLSRERWLRDAKIAEYRDAHRGRLPCEVCGFDFFDAYGELGKDFAHIHHEHSLGERRRPSLTTLSELHVVCANCHAMVHRNGECRSLSSIMIHTPKAR
jgi:5-methylcytosine-specific restriction enzyme A